MEEFEGRRRGLLTMENGATQSATCCAMCKRVLVGIGHERFENGCSVLGRHPGRGKQEAGVVSHCRRAAIGTPSYSVFVMNNYYCFINFPFVLQPYNICYVTSEIENSGYNHIIFHTFIVISK